MSEEFLQEMTLVLSPETDCTPGRESNQVYWSVSQFVEGGDRWLTGMPCYINFILYFICLNR